MADFARSPQEASDLPGLPSEAELRATLRSSATRPLTEQLSLLLMDQQRRWQAGCGWPAERYFSVAPQIAAQSMFRAELLAQEIACRTAAESADATTVVLARFPADAAAVQALLHRQAELADASTKQLGSLPTPAGPPPTDQAERFRVERELGAGAFGQVVVALDQQLHRRVALKRPRPDRWHDAQMRDAFLTEARHVARLRHPGIIALYDVVAASPDSLTIVMEYVDGESLSKRLAQGRPLQREAVDWVRQAAEAVHYAHERGLVHRDLKPANLLVDAQGQCRVADFGLAVEPTNAVGELAGTPAYMAPEQLLGTASDGVRSDVWSLGVTLYELLVGGRPFAGRTPAELAAAIQSNGAVDALLRHPALPGDVQPILRKCLQLDPQERYPTAAALAADLRAVHDAWLLPAQEPVPRLRRAMLAAGLIAFGLLFWGSVLEGLWGSFHVDVEQTSDLVEMSTAFVILEPLTLGAGVWLLVWWIVRRARQRATASALERQTELPQFLPDCVVSALAVGCGSLGWGPLAALFQCGLVPRAVRQWRKAGLSARSWWTLALGSILTFGGIAAWGLAAWRTRDFYRAVEYGEQAHAAAEKDELDAAIAGYSAGLAAMPEMAILLLERGVVYAARGDRDLARADFQRAEQLYEQYSLGSPLSQQRLAYVREMLRQEAPALRSPPPAPRP